MKAEFSFWGHNCFLIQTETEALLIDPWLNDTGAFSGSWHQWPPNGHLRDEVKQRCAGKSLSIFLTHEHQDHFDKATLREFASHPRCTVFVPAYEDEFLLCALRRMGFDAVVLPEGKQVGESIRFRIFIDDSCINHDSAIFVEAPGLSFFNQNDCKIFDRLASLKKDLGKVDFYSVQFSGANWYPYCFDMPAEQRRIVSRRNALNKLRNVREGIKVIAPRFFVPAAGPAFFPFLDPSLSIDTGTIFIHQQDLDNYLVQNGIANSLYPRPGEQITEHANRTPIAGPSSDDLEKYRSSHSHVWDQLGDTFSTARFAEILQRRLDLIAQVALPPDTPSVAFNWGANAADWLVVDLVNKTLVESSEPQAPCVILNASTKYFSLMCSGEERWQDIALSLQAVVKREPDIYNTLANIFLFADESNLVQSLRAHMNLSSERIVVEHLGEKYEINRYCPHQGGDLAYGVIDNDMHMVCPRHSWRFDLNCEGQCKSSGMSIHAVKLVNTNPLDEPPLVTGST